MFTACHHFFNSIGSCTEWNAEPCHISYFLCLLHPVTSAAGWHLSRTILFWISMTVLMTWMTWVQRRMTAAMKLSSLHFRLFIFDWEMSPGRTMSILTLCTFSKHLSTVFLQTARLFGVTVAANHGDFLGNYCIRFQCEQWLQMKKQWML